MTSTRKLKVLIADDSALMRAALRRLIESDSELQVVGAACDGIDTLEKIRALKPDVVSLDVDMPRLNGLSTLKRIMQQHPLPVIMVSALTEEGAQVTLDALDCGAFDYIPKHLAGSSLDISRIRGELIDKIKAAAASFERSPRSSAAIHQPHSVATADANVKRFLPEVVCIGTSTGGPKALQQLLPLLPESFPVGILVVQHMPLGFTGPFAQRLNSLSKIEVREASEFDQIEPGVALIAPATWHMLPCRRGSRFVVRLSKEPEDTLHRPAVDVMMLAAAEVFGRATVGVIMTGMGDDGARGMTAIHRAGGYTIGQDQNSCAVYGMPRSCAELGILDTVVPLNFLAQEIQLRCGPSDSGPLLDRPSETGHGVGGRSYV